MFWFVTRTSAEIKNKIQVRDLNLLAKFISTRAGHKLFCSGQPVSERLVSLRRVHIVVLGNLNL